MTITAILTPKTSRIAFGRTKPYANLSLSRFYYVARAWAALRLKVYACHLQPIRTRGGKNSRINEFQNRAWCGWNFWGRAIISDLHSLDYSSFISNLKCLSDDIARSETGLEIKGRQCTRPTEGIRVCQYETRRPPGAFTGIPRYACRDMFWSLMESLFT
jgi:hypothetical protein